MLAAGKWPRPLYHMDQPDVVRERFRQNAGTLLAELEELLELTANERYERDYYRSVVSPQRGAVPVEDVSGLGGNGIDGQAL